MSRPEDLPEAGAFTSPHQVSEVLDVDFTSEQLAAITAPLAPGVVIAGAGTGKTSVMAARVVWLVGTRQVLPEQVLGLTFTNKAAGELTARIGKALSAMQAPTRDVGPVDDDPMPTVSTYHAYAGRILTEQGMRIGIEPDARLLTDAMRYQLAMRVLRRARGPFPHFDKSLPRLAEQLLALDAELNEHLVDPARVTDHDRDLRAMLSALPKITSAGRNAMATAGARQDLLALVTAMRAEKQSLAVMDFGDQLAWTARLVREHPAVGVQERERFGVVLLDEYQDTSVAQKELLLDLFGGGHPVTAVGDPFQAIYGWRGASVHNILNFSKEFVDADGQPAATYSLRRNNRSGPAILAAANRASRDLRQDDALVGALEVAPHNADVGSLECGVFETAQDELTFGVDRVAELVRGGRPARDIAVLSRTTREIAPWHAALTKRGIAVEVVGLGGLLELPEIVDLVSYLRLLDDQTANPALLRVLSGSRWRLGAYDLRMLGRRATELAPSRRSLSEGDDEDEAERLTHALEDAVSESDPVDVVSLLEAALDPGDTPFTPQGRERLAAFAAQWESLRALASAPLADVVHAVMERIGLDLEVAIRDGAERRPESLMAFLDAVDAYSDLDGDATLRSLLTYLDIVALDDRSLGGQAPSPVDSVKLMTLHAAKGLEWPVVLLPDVTQSVFPSTRGGSTWITDAGVLPYHLRGDAADFPVVGDWSGEKGLKAFKAALKEVTQAEDRRLAYVAFTRAKELLVATSHWWGRSQVNPRGPSPFLVELREVCESGHGRIVEWIDEPAEKRNPHLAEATERQWPAAPEAERLAARQRAADEVRAAMSGQPPVTRPSATAPSATPLSAAAPTAEGPGRSDVPASTAASMALIEGWRADAALLTEELLVQASPITDVPMPSTLSASAVVELAANPEAFARRLRRPMPRRPVEAARRGTRFHLWVEHRFGQAALIDREDLTGAADERSAMSDEELIALQEAFERGPFADRVPHAVEAGFQLLLAGRVIRGRIDAVYREDERFLLVDWKTGRRRADPTQLAVYRLAWATMHGLPLDHVRAVFYDVRRGEIDEPELMDQPALEAVLTLQ